MGTVRSNTHPGMSSDAHRVDTLDRLPLDVQAHIVGPILAERMRHAVYDATTFANCPILGPLGDTDFEELMAVFRAASHCERRVGPADLSNALTLLSRAVAPALCAVDDGSHRRPRRVSPNSTPLIDALDLSADLDRVGPWCINVQFFPLRPGLDGVVWSKTDGYQFLDLDGPGSDESDNDLGESCRSIRLRMCALERRVQQLRICSRVRVRVVGL